MALGGGGGKDGGDAAFRKAKRLLEKKNLSDKEYFLCHERVDSYMSP